MKKIDYTISINKIANSINNEWELDDWLQWPPDMFALCALILNRTGLYKLTLMDTSWWQDGDWQGKIEELSGEWVKHTSNRLLGKKDQSRFKESTEISAWLEVLYREWYTNSPIDIDRLRVLGKVYLAADKKSEESERIRIFAETLVKFYILADASCSGLGFLGQSLDDGDLEHRIFMTTANLLLNSTGSLSTIPKFHGTVVPKMRTPRSGLAARSLGLHLTLHTTEVEVVWRTFPKLEKNKRNLNVLAIPYPPQIEDHDFVPGEDYGHVVKYFKGNTERETNQPFISGLIDKVWQLGSSEQIIDVLVLPEMALNDTQYTLMLSEFKKRFESQEGLLQPPMIVTGMIKGNEKGKTGYPGIDDTFQNEVRMAVFFSGNWYTTTQRKHHRWQLDKSQLEQYGLGGVMSTSEKWFEFCTIAQRRLTILAPNGWLALTALICEDLARQEPVSEIIRGIGPTLLMALLCDGPQLNARWPGRYATVLAEDPGTAVLSLTSMGMTLRSVPPKNAEKRKPVIGLWKDLYSSKAQELEMDKTEQALLMTLSAQYEEEFTLDGRSDGKSASVFKLISKTPVTIENVTSDHSESDPQQSEQDKEHRFSNIRELSALQYGVDAIIDILSCKKLSEDNFQRACDLIIHLLGGNQEPPRSKQYFRAQIIHKIRQAAVDPASVGISASSAEFSSVNMKAATSDLQYIIRTCNYDHNRSTAELFDLLIEICRKMVQDIERNSAEKLTPMSVLYNLYNRIVEWNSDSEEQTEINGMDAATAARMEKDISRYINDKAKSVTS